MSYSVSFNAAWKKSYISQIKVRKLHVDTYVNNVSKRDNSESLPVWLVETNNVSHRVPQYFIDITNMLTGHSHWLHYSSTGHSWIIPDHKEHFNLAITTDGAFSLLVGNGIGVPSDQSFVISGLECCSSNLEPWGKGYFRKWFHTHKCKEVFIRICISRYAFLEFSDCIEIFFQVCSVCSKRKTVTKCYEIVITKGYRVQVTRSMPVLVCFV